jgi:hypothetical protein
MSWVRSMMKARVVTPVAVSPPVNVIAGVPVR